MFKAKSVLVALGCLCAMLALAQARGGDDSKLFKLFGVSGDAIFEPVQNFVVPDYGTVPVAFVTNATLPLSEGCSGRGHDAGFVKAWIWLPDSPYEIECDPSAPCHDDPITEFNAYLRIYQSSGIIGSLHLGIQRSPIINPVGGRDVQYTYQCANPLTDQDFMPNIFEGTQQFRDVIGCVAFTFSGNNDQSPNILKINGGIQISLVGGHPQF